MCLWKSKWCWFRRNKKVSNYLQSEIDRAQNAVKMSAKIWLSLLCHILRWIIQFSMHNTPAGFVLLLLDFLHIQYIPLEQTDMSCVENNYKLKWFVLKFSDHNSSVNKSFSRDGGAIRLFEISTDWHKSEPIYVPCLWNSEFLCFKERL